MNDYNALAKSLISALQTSTNAQKAANNASLLNTNATINNQANAQGTLYSTQPSFRQSQAGAATLQQNAKLDTNFLTNKFNTQSSILDTKYKIDQMNRAINSMNKVQFYS